MKVKNIYWRYLANVEGLGWKRLELLLKYFGSVEEVWKSETKKWLELGVDKRVVKNFEQVKGMDKGNLEQDEWGFVSWEDEEYPSKLRNLASPPIGLYWEGDLSLMEKKSIAIVGTRRMSGYGKRMTERFTGELVKRGWVVVSGLASGVDATAHRVCVEQGGKTIAVLAHGLDMTYPSQNKQLREMIVRFGGLVLSEHPGDVKPIPKRFVVRNRIVAGLSDCVLVCEAPKKSGTKITVGFAAEQGKNVYVIPGSIDSYGYAGSVEIIRDGGTPVASVEDINI